MKDISKGLQLLLDNGLDKDLWVETDIPYAIMDIRHVIALSDSQKAPYNVTMIKNAFKIITRQYLNQLKRKYKNIKENMQFWIRITDKHVFDADLLLRLMQDLKIDKVTFYATNKPEISSCFTFMFKGKKYYGGIASRVPNEESTESEEALFDYKEDISIYHKIKFIKKKSMFDL